MRDAVRQCRIDGVFGDVAFDAEIVMAGVVFRQRAALQLHLVRRLPSSDDDFADATHGLRIGTHHRKDAQIVQDVFGGDGFAADARFGEGDVLGDARVEVVANHQHIEMLVDGIDRVGHGRVGRAGQDIGQAGRLDDVRGVATASTFGMEGVDGAALEGAQRGFDEARFVERVGVDGDLDVHLVGHRQAAVDGGRCRAPVFMQLQPHGAGFNLFAQRFRQAGVALAEKAEVHRESLGRFEHAVDVPRAGRAGRGKGAGRRAGAAADHRRHAGIERLVDLLRADEMDVGIDATGGDNHAFTGNDLGAGADDNRDAGLDVRVAGFADGGDTAVLQADVGLDDTGHRVDDQCIGDHGIDGFGRDTLTLAHAVADDLAAAEFHFLTVDRVVLLDPDDQLRIGQAQAVAGRRAEHFGIGLAGDFCAHSAPWIKPRKP